MADLPELYALRESFGWLPADWFMPAALAHGALLLCARDTAGILVATGCGVAFPPVGYVSNMMVRPDLQGQGIGQRLLRQLLDWFPGQGIERVDLEATDAGYPMYARHFGFVPRWPGHTAVLRTSPLLSHGARTARDADWEAIGRLDRAAYGGDRRIFLRELADAADTIIAVAEREGRVTAFGMATGARLGPLVAETEASAETVASLLLTHTAPGLRLQIGGAPNAGAFWSRLGFEILPSHDTRMTWGPAPNDRPEMVYAVIHGALG